MSFRDNPKINQIYEKYARQCNSQEGDPAYESHQRFLHDLATDLEDAYEKGKAEGRQRSKLKAARNMKNEGFDIETISEMTGLSPDEIAGLE